MLNLPYCSKVWVVSHYKSFCFGNSLFNLKLHVSHWDVVAAIGDFSTCFVNSWLMQGWFFVCVCGLPVSLLLPLPCQGEWYPGTCCPCSFQHRMSRRTINLFTYFSLRLCFFCGGKFTCGFHSMELPLVFCVLPLWMNELNERIEAQ